MDSEGDEEMNHLFDPPETKKRILTMIKSFQSNCAKGMKDFKSIEEDLNDWPTGNRNLQIDSMTENSAQTIQCSNNLIEELKILQTVFIYQGFHLPASYVSKNDAVKKGLPKDGSKSSVAGGDQSSQVNKRTISESDQSNVDGKAEDNVTSLSCKSVEDPYRISSVSSVSSEDFEDFEDYKKVIKKEKKKKARISTAEAAGKTSDSLSGTSDEEEDKYLRALKRLGRDLSGSDVNPDKLSPDVKKKEKKNPTSLNSKKKEKEKKTSEVNENKNDPFAEYCEELDASLLEDPSDALANGKSNHGESDEEILNSDADDPFEDLHNGSLEKKPTKKNRKRNCEDGKNYLEEKSDDDDDKVKESKNKKMDEIVLPAVVRIDDDKSSSSDEDGSSSSVKNRKKGSKDDTAASSSGNQARVEPIVNQKRKLKQILSDDDDEFRLSSGSDNSYFDNEDDDLYHHFEGSNKKIKAKRAQVNKITRTRIRKLKVLDDSDDSSVDEKEGGTNKDANGGEEDEEEDEDDEIEEVDKHGNLIPSSKKKKIRKIIGDEKLSQGTKSAAKAEKERWERLKEKQKKFNGLELADMEVGTGAGGLFSTFKRVILDNDENGKPIVQVDPALVKHLKEHQGQGIQFMYESTVESVSRFHSGDLGGGCILAHCMGLGKTFQVVTFLHTVMTNENFTNPPQPKNSKDTPVKPFFRSLILAPVNVILAWDKEFKKWLGHHRSLVDKDLNHCVLKSSSQRERADILKGWIQEGGVLIMGYTLFRMLSSYVPKSSKGISKKLASDHARIFKKALIDPGPDMVICDEGHQLKNDKAKITQAVANIKTLRRVCLTGTPLQNHLEEYFTMVDFVKPGLLGNRKEFKNRFENPIKNGQFMDSSNSDVRLMKRRAYCLHKELDKVVMRRDYKVLAPYLPPKREYIVYTRLSEMQRDLYAQYIRDCVGDTDLESLKARNLILPDSHQFGRICTHPYSLVIHKQELDQKEEKHVFEEEEAAWVTDGSDKKNGSDSDSDPESSSCKKGKGSKRGGNDVDSDIDEILPATSSGTNLATAGTRCSPSDSPPRPDTPEAIRGWWGDKVTEEDQNKIELSCKLMVLFQIIKKCEEAGDKLLANNIVN